MGLIDRVLMQKKPRPWPNQKRISISGTGSIEKDYILKLNVHRGNPVGDLVGTDIFLNNNCKTDFSDVRFTDAAGNQLQYFLHSHGNYEIVYDNKRLGSRNVVYNGVLYASDPTELALGLYKSNDNGQSWTLLLTNGRLVFIDSSGYIYAMAGSGLHLFRRSTDDGKTWATVIDMNPDAAVNWGMMCEDNLGNLFVGKYQTAFDAKIYRSTDKGATWTIVWSDATRQHTHGVAADPYTGYIYAGIDAENGTDKICLFRSTDNGATFTPLWVNDNAAFNRIVFTPTARFFSGGASGPCLGNTVFKTTDDATFTPVLQTSSSGQGMEILNNKIYVQTTTYGANAYSQIYQLDIDGSNPKTIWCGPYDADITFRGHMFGSRATTPTAETERHIILGTDNGGPIKYNFSRLYSGGSHFQSSFYVKIPSLPADGLDIYVLSGNSSAVSASSKDIFSQPGLVHPNPILRLLLDEGSGIVANDSSGNGRNGTITHTAGQGGWNTYQGRRAGPAYPFITPEGNSYNFNAGDIITVPTDAVLEALIKNFSIIAWIKSSVVDGGQHQLVGKGTGNSLWSLQVRSSMSGIGFTYGNGSANTYISYTPIGIASGYWRMVGIILDGSTPAKANLIVDGVISPPFNLTYDIVANTGAPLIIGADGAGSKKFTGDICDIQVYPSALTPLQVQQLYENRMLSATEPAVVTTLV